MFKKLMEKKKFNYLLIIGLTTILFLILYNKFIFRDYIYTYSISGDIGSDTMFSYYPILTYISNSIHGGNLDIFTLNGGLGVDISYLYSDYGNPIDLIAALFPIGYLAEGILFATFLKLNIISIFGFGFFKLCFKEKKSAIFSSIIWTFCSYTIIWGQHYAFCTQMMNFTIFMFLLQRWLKGAKKTIFVLIPFMGFFVLNNYYFFYMSGIFAAIYTAAGGVLQGYKIKHIFKRLVILFLSALLAVGMVFVLFVPIMNTFFNSARTTTVFDINIVKSLFNPYGKNLYLTELGRFLNSDMLGGGFSPPYKGVSNYYELAFLFSSLLAVFSLCYQLLYSKERLKKWILFLTTILFLAIPIFTYLLTFDKMTRRWTFCLIFINCFCIGKFIDDWDNQVSKNKRKIAVIGMGVIVGICGLLLAADMRGIVDVYKKTMAITLGFSLLYFAILYQRKLTGTIEKTLLFSLVIIELTVCNYFPINYRGIEKKVDFEKKYEDGTKEAINYLQSMDQSLYRISKNYNSVFLNDSLAQGYNGFNIYTSTNPKELWELAQNYDGVYQPSPSPNYINFHNYQFENLLGAKYLLSKTEIKGYDLVKKIQNIYIYKNKYDIPFGFLYEKSFDKKQIESLALPDKVNALSEGFTTDDSVPMAKAQFKTEKHFKSILSEFSDEYNCNINYNGTLTASVKNNNNIYLTFNLTEPVNTVEASADSIKIEMESKKAAGGTIYFDTGHGFNEFEKAEIKLNEGHNISEVYINSYTDIKRICIDFDFPVKQINIKDLSFGKYAESDIMKNIKNLEQNGMYDVNMKDSCFTGKINNTGSSDKMLQIPISYNDNWKAYIDGKEAQPFNINHGLVGLNITSGEHSIKLKYEIGISSINIIISFISLLIYFILLAKSGNRWSKKDQIEKDEGSREIQENHNIKN